MPDIPAPRILDLATSAAANVDVPPLARENAPRTPQVETLYEIAAPYHDAAYSSDNIVVGLGWAFMTPMVVVHEDSFYSYLHYPCDGPTPNSYNYCLEVIRDGQRFSSRPLNLGYEHVSTLNLPTGHRYSYQPPMMVLDRANDQLLISYWLRANGEGHYQSLHNLVALPLSGTEDWQVLATNELPQNTDANYLGGTLTDSGDVLLAGYGTNGTAQLSLDIFRISPPYDAWQPGFTLMSWESPTFRPGYFHVNEHRRNRRVQITFPLSNNEVCAANGRTDVPYKHVSSFLTAPHDQVAFRDQAAGDWVFTELASDVSPSLPNGDSCQVYVGRFPVAQFHDGSTGETYNVVRVWEMPTLPVAAFYIFRDGERITDTDGEPLNLALLFAPIIPADAWIASIQVTKVSGEYLLVAHVDTGAAELPTTNVIALLKTDDFVSFDGPHPIETHAYGTGHSLRVAKPGEVGNPDELDRLYIYHSGNLGIGGLNSQWRFAQLVILP